MLTWLGWVMFVLLLIWYFSSQSFSHRKRLNLRSYVIYLLMQDSIRESHKAKFEDWIRNSKAKNASELSFRAQDVIENMADKLASEGNSTLAARAILWNSEAAEELKKGYQDLG